ncbi:MULTISPECIES: flagellar protein FlgN [Solibacillus]|uniref:Flagellar protein FlgN n=1 Tax=Solibacillus merdavium TaxID=2762218 RepID=A0ABR8XHP4_9BACL|nr:flagellar protein FlgN [Solibacillus merdavium]MBD8031462.1 flagellar protein FlgN [Solibacillus merdavium]
MSIANIVVTLEKLEKMHKSLLELALAKTEYIKQGDMEKLDQLIKNEQAHVAAINKLEQQRQSMVTDYLRANGIALTDTPSVADVINAAENIESKESLVNVRERLVTLLNQLKIQNELNQKMVLNSLQFINVTLDAMRPQRTEQFNYSGAQIRGNSEITKRSFNEFKA